MSGAAGDRDAPSLPRARLPMPPLLTDLAAWVWRLLLLGLAAWLLLRVAERLYLVVLPLAAAVLLTALLAPAVGVLHRRGLPRAAAVAIVMVTALLATGAILSWVVDRGVAEYPLLLDQLTTAIQKLPVSGRTVRTWQDAIIGELQRNRAQYVQLVLVEAERAVELLTALVLLLFLTVVLLADGRRVWHWLVGRLPAPSRAAVNQAGVDAYTRLSAWVRGTAVIAAFHGVVVAVTLAVLRVPLVAPLAVLVFLGSFVPIVGAVAFGGVAVLIAFATQGLDAASILVAVLVVDNQVESHVLQPFLIGRYVRLHPLVVALVITAGGVLEGLAGAILAVPLTAAVYAAFVSSTSAPPDAARRPRSSSLYGRRLRTWRRVPDLEHRRTSVTDPPALPIDERFAQPAAAQALGRAAAALREHGIAAEVLDTVADARRRVAGLLPEGATVFTSTSETLRTSGIDADVNSSGRYASVRATLAGMDRATQRDEMRALAATPAFVVGSVHAVTEDGRLVIASATGSQLALYAYGAGKVIWVVGAQKVVPDLETALRRIETYGYPREDARARRASGTPSAIRKILVVNAEADPARSTLLLVREPIGFSLAGRP